METSRFALPASTGDSGTPRLASRPFTDAASAQPAPPSMNAMAGHEPLRPRLLPVGAWIGLARTSHYDALELRLHLGLSAEQFDGLGDTLFGRPAQHWLDFIPVYEAAVLAQEGCSQPEVEPSWWVRGGPGYWIWADDAVDFAGLRAGQATRIQRRARGGSRRGAWPVLVLPEGSGLPGWRIAECHWPCGIGHPPNRPDAAECPLADGCQLAGHCLWHWICASVACAREAIALMALADRPLHKPLEARWPQADRQHVEDAVERALLHYLDSGGQQATASVSVYLPPSAYYAYDPNGNLLSDGNRWFAYDGKMRMRQRVEYAWSAGGWNASSSVRYAYDGNVVVGEQDQNNTPKVSYTRGNDLSGSIQGAGGIGGLLGRTDNTLGTNAYYFADGNGNITCLTDTNQAVVATYLYDPYGRILSQSGWLANANLYRFSSKEFHVNSGLAYYLYRFYDQNLQRWLNRDPMETDAGQSTYGFALESPVNNYDPFGLATCAQFNKELPSIEGRDPKTKQLLGYLATNRCSFNITCYEGADCAKQGIKAGGVASSPLNYGPGKGTCAIGVCASRLPNAFFFREIVRHELAHCAFYCSNPGVPDTCASHLCSEVYAYGSDGRCSGYPQGSQRYYNCLASWAKRSAALGGACAGQNMDGILTQTFMKSCLQAQMPKQQLPLPTKPKPSQTN